MDSEQALSAHINWKAKLRTYLAKPDHSLAPSEVAQDEKCDLGRWIAAESEQHSGLREFQTMRSQHVRLHSAAADVVRLAGLGQSVTEDSDLRKELSAASIAFVSAILALKEEIEKQGAAHKKKRESVGSGFPN